MDVSFLRVCIGESLFKLPLGLNTSVLHVLEVLTHILHLILQLLEVLVLFLLLLYHF
jgi:hypothetical protein